MKSTWQFESENRIADSWYTLIFDVSFFLQLHALCVGVIDFDLSTMSMKKIRRLTYVFQQFSLSSSAQWIIYGKLESEWKMGYKVRKICDVNVSIECVGISNGDFSFPMKSIYMSHHVNERTHRNALSKLLLNIIAFFMVLGRDMMSVDAFMWLINCSNWIKCVTTHHRQNENKHLLNMKSMP